MSSSPADPFEFLKNLWTPMGLPMPGIGTPGMLFPSVDVTEIERRISDMRSVESWLALNLEIVRTTVKALEAQRSTLQAFQAMQKSAAGTADPAAAPGDKAPAADASGPAPAKRARKAT